MSKSEKSKNKRQSGSALEFALHCCVARAVKVAPVFAAGGPGIIVLIAPKGREVFEYMHAAVTVLQDGEYGYTGRDFGVMCIAPKDRAAKVIGQFESECRDKRRAIVIAASRESVPSVIGLAADAVHEVSAILAKDFRAACRCVLNIEVSEEQAERALSFPETLLWSALRVARPIEESLRRLAEVSSGSGERYQLIETRARSVTAPRLEDMHGYGQAKVWGLQLASDLAAWRDGKLSWSDIDKGLLLSGPPGVGKTQFARSLAATCDCHFIASSLGQWQARGHLGDLLKAMRSDFDAAREKAPTILLIDELDSIGDRQTFSGDHVNYSVQVVNALLESIDGSIGREGVVIIGATNAVDRIDPAILRAGRLDKHVVISLPSEEDRLAILEHHLNGLLTYQHLAELGPQTEGMSGADLEQLARQARREARKERRLLTVEDLRAHLPELVPVEGFYRKAVSVHEAGHVLVACHLGYGEFVGVAIARQLNPRFQEQHAGAAMFRFKQATFRDRQSYLDEICTYLAGIAAEQLVFGRHGDGAGVGKDNDLRRATNLASLIEANLGMGEGLRYVDFADRKTLHADKQISKKIDDVLRSEFVRAQSILSDGRALLDTLSKELHETGHVSAERFAELRRTCQEEKALAS